MADDDSTPTPRGDRPVLTGLVALVGVAVVVGLVLGGAALAATKVLGIGDEGGSSDGASAGDSLYLPPPEKTEPSSPATSDDASDGLDGSAEPVDPETPESTEPETQISLSAGQTQVTPMGQIDLTGVYPGGEAAVLRVQRFEGGRWEDFPVTASVTNETFATYVQSSMLGVNRFRVVDTDNREASNEVRVTID